MAKFFRQTAQVVCLFLGFGSTEPLQAQPKRFQPAPDYGQLGKPDQNAGRKILEQFRQHGLYPGQHYLEFTLTVLPRRGPERTVPGRLWGTENEKGNLTRLVLTPGGGAAETRLLVQIGPESAVWSWHSGQLTAAALLPVSGLFDHLAGTDVNAFDLEMPFLYWPQARFEGVSKVRGRPAHVYLLTAPPEISALPGGLTGVRLYLDAQYNVVVEFQELGVGDALLKTVSAVDLKKVGDQWIVKEIDYRDEVTRNKSRFTVTAVGENLEFSPALFTPAALNDSIQSPAPDHLVKTGP